MGKIKQNKQKKEEKFGLKDFAFFGMVLLLYFFYIKTKDEIVNYPTWLTYTAFLITVTVVIFAHLKKFKKEFILQKGTDLYFSIALILAKIIIISLFLAGIILIPFNYYNIYKAKEKPLEVAKCEIKGVSTYSKNRKIFFVLYGRTNVMYGFTPIMEDIKANGKFKDYYFVAEIRKGFLNSYILENWSIERK
jgi:drug/metabolite transporter (DMT)-like permease